MNRLSTSFRTCLILLMLNLATSYAETPRWPLKGEIDLSSGFGDFRRSRFHAGLDLRTGGVTGQPVVAPTDGWISRIKMSYTGYGKGLYFTGDDHSIYVFGHLSGFPSALDARVKHDQYAQKRYYVDLTFPTDSIRVKAGDLLAYSGQTGAGAPHLHFERRAADNRPVNPLTHGFRITDKVKPSFTRVGVQLTDDHSLLPDGTRRAFYDLSPRKGTYGVSECLYFDSPFGLLIDGFDQARSGGMKQAIYHLTLLVDDRNYFDVLLDTLDFAEGKAADFVYDYLSAVDGEPRVRQLYHQRGDPYTGVTTDSLARGIIGLTPLNVGRHQVRIVGTDVQGNSAETRFEFIWGSPDGLFRLDTSIVINDSTMQFLVSPNADLTQLKIDSVVVFVNDKERWGRPKTAWVRPQPDGRLKLDIKGHLIERVVMRLEIYPKGGGHFGDLIFCGVRPLGQQKFSVEHEVLDDGLLVRTRHIRPIAGKSHLELYYKGALLGSVPISRFVGASHHAFFVPPRPEYRFVDRLLVRMSPDTAESVGRGELVRLTAAGFDSTTTFSVDSLMTVRFSKESLYGPRFLELAMERMTVKGALKMNSDAYKLRPSEFPSRQPFQLTYRIPIPNEANPRSGICRLDDSGKSWIWLGGMGSDSLLHGNSAQGGMFGAVFDYDAPTISDLNVTDGTLVRDSMPTIRFSLRDDLSGIEDDRNILIKIDGQWVIPEYDPESGICQTGPAKPLGLGEHHLSIEVTDRVGNQGSRYLKFRVSGVQKATSGKK
jgi:hypothetical protein